MANTYTQIYIQVRHHARNTFRQEYLRFLKKFEIQHDERYLFKSLETQ